MRELQRLFGAAAVAAVCGLIFNFAAHGQTPRATSTTFVTTSQGAARSVSDGIYTSEQAGRGRALFGKHCASCHMDDLSGGHMTPSLAGQDFTSAWDGSPVSELLIRIRTTMPPDSPSTLTDQQYVDLISFMFQANSWPSGERELPADIDALKRISIRRIK
jgi:mono/diheme cytochrome c family protein